MRKTQLAMRWEFEAPGRIVATTPKGGRPWLVCYCMDPDIAARIVGLHNKDVEGRKGKEDKSK